MEQSLLPRISFYKGTLQYQGSIETFRTPEVIQETVIYEMHRDVPTQRLVSRLC
jgi:hypothetical protein